MFTKTKLSYYKLGAGLTLGMLAATSAGTAHAAAANNFGTLSANIVNSIADVPGLLSAVCYLFGILLVILGILKVKEHVEKPDQTPIREGATRLFIGGFLFALPLILDVAKGSIDAGDAGNAVTSAQMQQVTFGVGGGGGGGAAP